MGLVDGFAKGVSLGNDIHRTEIADEDAKLRRIQAEKDSSYQEWARAEQKLSSADEKDLRIIKGFSYRLSQDPKALMTEEELEVARKYDPVIDEYMGLDDAGLKTQARALDKMVKRFSGEFIPKTELTESVNTVYDKQIGEGKTIADFFPSPDNEGLVFSLNVNNEDGSVSQKPLTPYRLTEEDGDNNVKVIPISEFADDVQKRTRLINSLNSMRVSLGDNTPVASAAKNAEKLEKRAYELLTKQEQREYDQQTEAGKQAFQLKLEGIKQKNRVSLANAKGGSTKTDLITLKTGKKVTLNDARQAYLATYGKPDGMGGFAINESAPKFDQWLNEQAVDPVFSDTVDPVRQEEMYKQARAQAEQEAKDRAGFFSSDNSDFSKDGGNRADFIERRTQELLQTYGGGDQEQPQKPSGGMAAAGEAIPLDEETAIALLKEAKGDKALARKLALEYGYSL